jgi:hypothetical protein
LIALSTISATKVPAPATTFAAKLRVARRSPSSLRSVEISMSSTRSAGIAVSRMLAVMTTATSIMPCAIRIGRSPGLSLPGNSSTSRSATGREPNATEPKP